MKRALSTSIKVPALVSTAWLSSNLKAVKVVDASWYLPAMQRDAKAEFAAKRIPGAVFFDVDATDATSSLPHMLPTDGFFQQTMGELCIGSEDHVICYDGKGIFSAGRLWWMLRAYGHEKASVLDGGLPLWESKGLPMETGPPPSPPPLTSAPFVASLASSKVCSVEKLKGLVEASKVAVVGARAQARFENGPEARAGCRSGHIPGSRCVPFTAVLTADGTMKDPDEIKAVFTAAGVDASAPELIGSCGSGVTAAVLALAMEHSGVRGDLLEIYDGSWAEWGSDTSLPIATGPVELS